MEPKGREMLGVQAQVALTTGPVRCLQCAATLYKNRV